MAIYAIGDPHLSLGVKKPMDIFPGWDGYIEKLTENWQRFIQPEDTVVLAGDISWGMTLQQALPDLQLLDNLPGQKIIMKGNHDYWWNSFKKMNDFFAENDITTLRILHNNSYEVEGVNLCGSRGWLFESGQAHDEKIINREAMRIEMSLSSVQNPELETLLFLHYPPLFGEQTLDVFFTIMQKYGIKQCFYGHIHGAGHRSAIQGYAHGIHFAMISADYLAFCPKRVYP